jgi:hypothetical protein
MPGCAPGGPRKPGRARADLPWAPARNRPWRAKRRRGLRCGSSLCICVCRSAQHLPWPRLICRAPCPAPALCQVLVPTKEFVAKLQAARLAADVCDVPTVLIARTDALGAYLMTSDVDEYDRPFLTGEPVALRPAAGQTAAEGAALGRASIVLSGLDALGAGRGGGARQGPPPAPAPTRLPSSRSPPAPPQASAPPRASTASAAASTPPSRAASRTRPTLTCCGSRPATPRWRRPRCGFDQGLTGLQPGADRAPTCR